jgi:hypothetical protein
VIALPSVRPDTAVGTTTYAAPTATAAHHSAPSQYTILAMRPTTIESMYQPANRRDRDAINSSRTRSPRATDATVAAGGAGVMGRCGIDMSLGDELELRSYVSVAGLGKHQRRVGQHNAWVARLTVRRRDRSMTGHPD